MSINSLIWVSSLLLLSKASLLPSLDVQDILCGTGDVTDEENLFHDQYWATMKIIAKVSLSLVIVIWTLLNFRFVLDFKKRYEYVSSLMIIFILPLFYVIMSYFSIHDRNNNGHLDLIKGFYEVFLLFGVFGLMKTYVAFDSEADVFRRDVLYEVLKEHKKVSLFSLPDQDSSNKPKWWLRPIIRVKKIFFFSLSTTEEAKEFVSYINKSLWIFAIATLITLIVDLVAKPADWVSMILETVGVLSMTVAIAYSYIFVHAIESSIKVARPSRKFFTVKIFLSLTFYQDYILHWFLYYDYAGGWAYVSAAIKDDVVIWTGDALICVEMILFCLLLAWAFPYSRFKKHEVYVGTQLARKYHGLLKQSQTVDEDKNGVNFEEIEMGSNGKLQNSNEVKEYAKNKVKEPSEVEERGSFREEKESP